MGIPPGKALAPSRGEILEPELEADRHLIRVGRPREIRHAGATGMVGPRPFKTHTHARIEVVTNAYAVIQANDLPAAGAVRSAGARRQLGGSVRLLIADAAIYGK